MTQPAAKKGKGRGCGKPAPEWTLREMDGTPAMATPESTEEDIASLSDLPTPADWPLEGGPTKVEFCRTQMESPTLEGTRKQAEAQVAGVLGAITFTGRTTSFIMSLRFLCMGQQGPWWSPNATGPSYFSWLMGFPWQDTWVNTRPLQGLSPLLLAQDQDILTCIL